MAKKTARASTLTLFDDDLSASSESAIVDTSATLKWSFSKRGVLKQCPRKFYYQYYGAHLHKAKNDLDKETLRKLKMMVSRQERTGQILHFTVAHYLRQAQTGNPMTDEGLVSWARRAFQKDLMLSRQGFARAALSTDARSPRFLLEFLSEEDANDLCAEAEADMIEALEMFLKAPQFAAVRELGMRAGTAIEKHFYNLPGIPFGVEGQVDLAHVAEGGVTIVDWKSGEDMGDGDDSLQLAVYALWATDAYACDADSITVQKAFLGSGDLVTFPLTNKTLSSARLVILQDAQCFARMHEYGCASVQEAFTPCAQEAVCRRCPFVAVCPEGKESLEW